MDKPEYIRGQWAALDAVLNHINTMGETGEKFRQRLYQDVLAMRPRDPVEERCPHCGLDVLKDHGCVLPIQVKHCHWKQSARDHDHAG